MQPLIAMHSELILELPPMKRLVLPAALLVAALLCAPATRAGEGHDHGDAAPAPAGEALPRFTAVSETFELVGVLSGKELTLYLDRYADNSPVRDAQIELEIAGTKFTARAAQGRLGDDEYQVELAEAPKPGVLPVTATVTAGSETDLLAGEFDLHEEAHAAEATPKLAWKKAAGWSAVGIAALALLFWGWRRSTGTRAARTGGAA
jgi:hypothetical protein